MRTLAAVRYASSRATALMDMTSEQAAAMVAAAFAAGVKAGKRESMAEGARERKETEGDSDGA